MNELIYIHNTADQKLVMKDILKDCWTTARWAAAAKLGHMMPTASARFEGATSETTVLLISYSFHDAVASHISAVQCLASCFSNVLVPNKGWVFDMI